MVQRIFISQLLQTGKRRKSDWADHMWRGWESSLSSPAGYRTLYGLRALIVRITVDNDDDRYPHGHLTPE